jgi:outer membrane translocation and assembly module TamA
MAGKVLRTISLLALGSSLLICASGRAQVSSVPPACSSILAASQKLPANTSAEPNSEKAKTPTRKVIVDRIEFDRPVHLSDADVQEVIKTANDAEYDADSPAWVDELSEIGLRHAWQDQGYFQIALDPKARAIGGDAGHERFIVDVHILNEGPQFHLGTIHFSGDSGIPEGELREALAMREGEIYSAAHVRGGVTALTKLFDAHGYIDFTVVPETAVNEDLQRVDLTMGLDQQKQYRVGSVTIRGLDPTLEARLRSIVVPGEIMDYQSIADFFKEYKAVLPPRGIDNFDFRRNAKTGIVDLTFDPKGCS